MTGIDVSSHQGTIDWSKVKNSVDFAIIRCGYGDNIPSQDDSQFMNNVKGCISNDIPFGVYLYSYAKNSTGDESIESEINHVKRLVSSLSSKPFCIYIDMEDDSTTSLGKTKLTSFANQFCKAITNLGYKAGVYANENWCKNYLNVKEIANNGYSIWCAKYSTSKPSISASYDIWQYSSSGTVSGITGNVDMNTMYNDITNKSSSTSSSSSSSIDITYQTWDDVKNKWLPSVKNDSDYAGIFGHDVCCVYANSSKGNVYYRVHYKGDKGGKWLSQVTNRTDYAGIYNKPIDAFMIKCDSKSLKYRVHLRRSNKWLPWVTGYSTSDSNNGYAGIIGQEIDGVQIK